MANLVSYYFQSSKTGAHSVPVMLDIATATRVMIETQGQSDSVYDKIVVQNQSNTTTKIEMIPTRDYDPANNAALIAGTIAMPNYFWGKNMNGLALYKEEFPFQPENYKYFIILS